MTLVTVNEKLAAFKEMLKAEIADGGVVLLGLTDVATLVEDGKTVICVTLESDYAVEDIEFDEIQGTAWVTFADLDDAFAAIEEYGIAEMLPVRA